MVQSFFYNTNPSFAVAAKPTASCLLPVYFGDMRAPAYRKRVRQSGRRSRIL
jgi:hypothetical protein